MTPQKRPRFRMTTLGLAIAVVLSAIPIMSQTSRPSFEVAVIKPNPYSGGPTSSGIGQRPGGRVTMTNVTLKAMLTYAYDVRDFQVLDGPDWINSDRYDVEAKAEEVSVPAGSADPSVPAPQKLMTQSLIDERFQMKMHRETRELPIYELVTMKGGAKLQMSEDQSAPKPPEPGTRRRLREARPRDAAE